MKNNDTLHTRITFEGLKDVKDGERGVITVKVEVVNHDDVAACTFFGSFIMRKGDI